MEGLISISNEQKKYMKQVLSNMFKQILGKEKKLTAKKVGGNAGYWRDNVSKNHPVNKYYKALNNNPHAALKDLKMRFPEVWKAYGFGSPVKPKRKAVAKPASTASVKKTGLNSQYLLIAAAIAGIVYFLKVN
jgi:ribosomal protein S7